MSHIVVIGNGYVGTAYAGMLRRHYRVHVHDPEKGLNASDMTMRDALAAFVCVPTPRAEDGSCDTSIVEHVVKEYPVTDAVLVIKSTVPPGTTIELQRKTGHKLVFSPEYIGEGGYYVPPEFPAPHDPTSHRFAVLGGYHKDCSLVADILMRVMGPSTRFRFMRSDEAEAVKYFENAFLALKVMYANEMRRLCDKLGLNYHTVREGWLDDPRVGTSHSAAFRTSPGFNGKCLPKDTAALEFFARQHGIPMPLLNALIAANGMPDSTEAGI